MNIVIIAGSNRQAATSTRLAEYIQTLLEQQGEQVTMFDLYQTPLPFYCPDEYVEDHHDLTALKKAMLAANGVILTTPEYHGSISGVLKNALDHLNQDHFRGKPVLSVSSAGGAVGVSSLTQMQAIVRNLHGINSPQWISIDGDQRQNFQGRTGEPFDVNPQMDERIRHSLNSFVELTRLLGK